MTGQIREKCYKLFPDRKKLFYIDVNLEFGNPVYKLLDIQCNLNIKKIWKTIGIFFKQFVKNKK